jgi:hypothetical protein
LIIGKYNHKSIQWKITFLNSNINSHPHSETIKRENVERFILNLKADDLYAELEGEINEFLEFEVFYLASEDLKKKLICPNCLMEISLNNLLPIKFYRNNLVVKNVEKIVSLDVINLQSDFCVDSKMKQNIWDNLLHVKKLVEFETSIGWIPIKRLAVNLIHFENPTQKLKRF